MPEDHDENSDNSLTPAYRVINPRELTAEFLVAPPQRRRAPLRGHLAYRVTDDGLFLRSITELKTTNSRPLTAGMLRFLPMREIETEIATMLDDALASRFSGRFDEPLTGLGQIPAKSITRRNSIGETELLDIAVAYSALRSEPKPFVVLAEQLHYGRDYLRQLVSRARRAGLLGETSPGRRNHQLTEKARQMIRDRQQNEDNPMGGQQ
ncbi:MAG: hypothetical protein HN750_00290 [Gemmatimonadales bacterium]|nr:hypothetical protein [Gemmatimonadales bacterium]